MKGGQRGVRGVGGQGRVNWGQGEDKVGLMGAEGGPRLDEGGTKETKGGPIGDQGGTKGDHGGTKGEPSQEQGVGEVNFLGRCEITAFSHRPSWDGVK